MKFLKSSKTIQIPEGVVIKLKARQLTVTGPKGTLSRDLRHQPVEFEHDEKRRIVTVSKWLGTKTELAVLQTFATHLNNMIIGVTRGFRYKMRFVYAHFPINVNIEGGKGPEPQVVEIRNFLGEKKVRRVPMRGNTKVTKTTTVKDEIVLEGINVEDVAQSAADIHRSCMVHDKDLRKFLDGMYVSEKGPVPLAQ